MKKSTIYTCTGDLGETSLVGGKRVAKHDIRLDAYGTIDELNAHIGMLTALLPQSIQDELAPLRVIQHRLFAIGGYLATDATDTALREASRIEPTDIEYIEHRIDTLDATLPALHNFILPGGTPASAQAHICRTVCRRAERAICALHAQQPIDTEILQYVNRLSDYLFILSRLCNTAEGVAEICWDKRS